MYNYYKDCNLFFFKLRNLPISIMVGIPLTTACYILANIGYLGVMSKEEIIVSHAVAVVSESASIFNGIVFCPNIK
jgi:hypothetical protein